MKFQNFIQNQVENKHNAQKEHNSITKSKQVESNSNIPKISNSKLKRTTNTS